MTFFPRIFKSVQAITSGIVPPGTNTGTISISSVNTSYSAVQWQGSSGGSLSGSFSGTNDIALSIVGATTVQWDRGYSNVGLDKSAEVYGSVVEFFPNFLRQAISTFFANGTFAHGLSLGSKAYIIFGGHYSTQADGGGTDSSTLVSACKIVGANVVFSAFGGANIRGYIVDPI